MAAMSDYQPDGSSADLVGQMGRQLREPLHALVGLVELLGSSRLPADTREVVRHVRSRVLDLRSLVDDLVDSSQLQAGALALRVRPVALGALVAEVVAAGTARVANDDVQVVADIGPGVPAAVMVDPWRLRQMLDRLVAHVARRCSSGRIAVGVDRSTLNDGVATMQFVVSGSAQVAASDSGVVLAEQLAHAMGGRVAATDSLDGFIVTLPLAITDLPPVDLEHDITLDGADVSVLVVDDEPVNRLLALEQLQRLGLRASAVGTGEEAVLAVADTSPDIVLMDVVMPGIDGLEATRQIRDHERATGRRCIIIGVTASSLATDRVTAEDAGMNDVLAKPVNLATLGDAIGRWVRGGVHVNAERDAVDVDVLNDLCTDLGGTALVSNVVRMYLNELHGRRRALAEAVDRGDLAAAKAVAHTLKSGSAMLGAQRLADMCEAVGHLDTTAELNQVAADIMRASTAASHWLHRWLADQPS